MIKKNVIISVSGQSNIEGEEAIELVTEGNLYKKNDKYYITYKETDITGMKGTTTTLKVEDDDTVTLIRKGAINSNFVFKKGQKNVSHYLTEYGMFTVGIKAQDVKINVDNNGGEVSVKYNLDIFNGDSKKNNFHMTIREVQNNDKHNSTN